MQAVAKRKCINIMKNVLWVLMSAAITPDKGKVIYIIYQKATSKMFG